MLKKLLLLVVTGFFLASCAATNTQQGGDVDAASSSTSSGSDSSITAGTQEDLIVNVGDRVFFEFDSSELTVDAQATLDAQAAWLVQYPDTNITIEGHADEDGSEKYNLGLSMRRAQAVADFLINAGISPNRIEIQALGKSVPAIRESDEDAKARNRRVVILESNPKTY